MKTKEEILKEYNLWNCGTTNTSLLLAMHDYARQQTKELQEQLAEKEKYEDNLRGEAQFFEDKLDEAESEIETLKEQLAAKEKECEKLKGNIKNAMIDISNYITTLELRNDFNNDIEEFTKKRDWFIDYILNQLK